MKKRHLKFTQRKPEQQFRWPKHIHDQGESRLLAQDAVRSRVTTPSLLQAGYKGSDAPRNIRGTQTAISRIIDPVPHGSQPAAPGRNAFGQSMSYNLRAEQHSETSSSHEPSAESLGTESNGQGDPGQTNALDMLIEATRAKFKSVSDLAVRHEEEDERRKGDLMQSIRALDEIFASDPDACEAWMLKEAGKVNKRTINPCYRFVKAAAPKGTHRQQVQHLAKVLWVLRKREIASSDVLNALTQTTMKEMRETYDNEGPREPQTKRAGNTDAPQTNQETTNTLDFNEEAPESRVQPLEHLIAHGSIQVLVEGRAIPVIGLVSVGLTYTLFLEEAQA